MCVCVKTELKAVQDRCSITWWSARKLSVEDFAMRQLVVVVARAIPSVFACSWAHDSLEMLVSQEVADCKGKTLKKLKNPSKTHVSGSIFLNHWLLSASSAVILFSGSSVSILSNRSKAESGMYANSSRSLLRYCFFGCSELKCGNLMTFGHTAGVGDPQSLEMISSCNGSELPWKRVFFAKSSPRMQPTDHTSIDGPYLMHDWVNYGTYLQV